MDYAYRRIVIHGCGHRSSLLREPVCHTVLMHALATPFDHEQLPFRLPPSDMDFMMQLAATVSGKKYKLYKTFDVRFARWPLKL